MKKELFLFVFLSVFITLIDLGAQIRGAQTRYTVVNFGLNQPLHLLYHVWSCKSWYGILRRLFFFLVFFVEMGDF